MGVSFVFYLYDEDSTISVTLDCIGKSVWSWCHSPSSPPIRRPVSVKSFRLRLVIKLHLLRMRHDYFADPRGICSRLHGNETLRYLRKYLFHRFRCRGHFLFQKDFTRFTQNAVARPVIA